MMAWADSAPIFAWGRLAPLPITHARRQDLKGTCPHASCLSLSSVVGSRGSLAVRSGASTLASSTASSRLCTLISRAAALVASPGRRGPLLVVGLTAGSLARRNFANPLSWWLPLLGSAEVHVGVM